VRDLDLEAAVTEADRVLAEAQAELATLRSASTARDEDAAAIRRAEAVRAAEAETATRRLADAERRAAEERAAATTAIARRDEVVARADAARRALEFAAGAERNAQAARETARLASGSAEAERSASAERLASAAANVASLRGRVEALASHLDEDEHRPIARAARKRGGRRLDEDLTVDPELRPAIEAALADRVRAYLVAAEQVSALAGERGHLLVEERMTANGPAADALTRRWLDAVAAAGGGRLADGVRRDGTGGVRRLLERAVWLPGLKDCLALQSAMPPGWVAVPRDGTAVLDDTGLALGTSDPVLDRRAEHARLATDLERAEEELAELRTSAAAAEQRAAVARATLDEARAEETRLVADRRRTEESERAALRESEAAAREAAWHEAQQARLGAELTRLRESVATDPVTDEEPTDDKPTGDERAALTAWESRATELRDRRDRLAARSATHDAARRDAEHARARADAAVAIAEERIARADREAATLVERENALLSDRDGTSTETAAATTREREAREALLALHAADAADRSRLAESERAAATARERLRAADERARAADHAELEARLGLESLRDSVLIELAGLGELGLTSLGIERPDVAADTDIEGDAEDASTLDATALESALTALSERWAGEPPMESPPSPGRLAQLRRRYHELGAANPYAVEEYAELKARLESLETQGDDLRAAIDRTRELIVELDTMIATQFRTTFAALETAFERRFEQLFDGGFAKLSLTDPSDLGSTGVEIVARPPGKKPQALAMLSGGERALTAVALLFAMLEVRPVPFCVLDEVDAALDEANIGRFAEALRSLADRTQFIVITHNRGTIEAADALYGVTVGDDSVSRVISLRLDEAQALASERRELSAAG
jgi:chromosome segregation protein